VKYCVKSTSFRCHPPGASRGIPSVSELIVSFATRRKIVKNPVGVAQPDVPFSDSVE